MGTPNLISLLRQIRREKEKEIIGSVPGAHKATHENGGGDEVSVTGLSGLLADDQHVLDAEVLAVAAALVHAARHQNGGLDEVNVGGLSGLLADDQHVLDAEVLAVAAALVHGIGSHTDVTRTFFIPNGNYTTGTILIANKHDIIQLDEDIAQVAVAEFRVPSDFVSFSSLKVVWFSGAGGTAGQDWVCDPHCYYAADGEISSTHQDAPANTTIDVTAKLFIYETDVGFTLANLAAGDYVGVEIQREAADGADTYTAVIRIIGLLLTYTAEQ